MSNRTCDPSPAAGPADLTPEERDREGRLLLAEQLDVRLHRVERALRVLADGLRNEGEWDTSNPEAVLRLMGSALTIVMDETGKLEAMIMRPDPPARS